MSTGIEFLIKNELDRHIGRLDRHIGREVARLKLPVIWHRDVSPYSWWFTAHLRTDTKKMVGPGGPGIPYLSRVTKQLEHLARSAERQ